MFKAPPESGPEIPDSFAQVRAERSALRRRLVERLELEDAHDLARRLSKCGEELKLVCTGCGVGKRVEKRCDLKWCPSCQNAIAAATAERYSRIAAIAVNPLLVTMTAKNFGYAEDWPRVTRKSGKVETLSPIRMLRQVAWAEKFRRLAWFRKKVVGGVTAFEITDTGKGYHIHCHGLWDCRWLSVTESAPKIGADKATWKRKGRRSMEEVGGQWSLCCDRAASVHVRRLWTRDGDITAAVREVVKYSVKGSDLVTMKRDCAPIIRMVDTTRMVTSFGTFHGRPEIKRDKGQGCPCESCGTSGAMVPEFMTGPEFRDSWSYTSHGSPGTGERAEDIPGLL